MNPQPYQLLSTTRFDPFLFTLAWNNDSEGPSPFLLLPYHFNRLMVAADRHGWPQFKAPLTYEILKANCEMSVRRHHKGSQTAAALRIRLLLSESGTLQLLVAPIKSLHMDPMTSSSFNPQSDSTPSNITTLYIDTQPTSTSLFTMTKTTDRTVYNDARLRVSLPLIPDMKADVLLHNTHGFITETSICNVAFYRSSMWLTPATSTGCLPGVFRQWLLEKGFILEDTENILTRDSIQPGEWVLLFNGVHGCHIGRTSGSGRNRLS